MLPRYALGNWWSRYYEYTEESYLELMHRFDEEGIPFTVAVIDMDWHLVNIDPNMAPAGPAIHGIKNFSRILKGLWITSMREECGLR